jgi:hypothetical protein
LIISTIPAHIAADCSAFELGLLARVVDALTQPVPAGDAALVAEAIRLHALGQVLPS